MGRPCGISFHARSPQEFSGESASTRRLLPHFTHEKHIPREYPAQQFCLAHSRRLPLSASHTPERASHAYSDANLDGGNLIFHIALPPRTVPMIVIEVAVVVHALPIHRFSTILPVLPSLDILNIFDYIW